MLIYYNSKLNMFGLAEASWEYVLCKRLTYINGPKKRRGQALVSDLQLKGNDWTLITNL